MKPYDKYLELRKKYLPLCDGTFEVNGDKLILTLEKESGALPLVAWVTLYEIGKGEISVQIPFDILPADMLDEH